jgi:hypothetical protein
MPPFDRRKFRETSTSREQQSQARNKQVMSTSNNTSRQAEITSLCPFEELTDHGKQLLP